MLYLLIDNISEFFGSHFRCNNHPVLYFFIRSIILGIFIFFVSTLYAYLKIDDFGVGDIIFNLLNGILIGFFTSIFILIWGKIVEFIDRISRK